MNDDIAFRNETQPANVPSGIQGGQSDLINFDTAKTDKPLIDFTGGDQNDKKDSDDEPVSPPSALSKSDKSDGDDKKDGSDSDVD
mgnify:CR=1 FL=1